MTVKAVRKTVLIEMMDDIKIKANTIAVIAGNSCQPDLIENAKAYFLHIKDPIIRINALSVLICLLAKNGKVDEGLRLNSLLDRQMDKEANILHIAIRLASIKHDKEAFNVFQKLEYEMSKDIFYSKLACRYIAENRIEKANKIIVKITNDGIRMNPMEYWVKKLTVAHKFKLAIETLLSMKELSDWKKNDCLTYIARHLAEQGQHKQALTVTIQRNF